MTATCGIQKFPLAGKNKTLVKILGGRQHRSNIGGRDPCNPWGVDAYVSSYRTCVPVSVNVYGGAWLVVDMVAMLAGGGGCV